MNNPDPALFRQGKSLVVAVDGPSGSGKSSVSREAARRFRAAYLDTGAMYRAVTWHCLDRGLDLTDGEAVEAAAKSVKIELSTDPDVDSVKVEGRDVTAAIREPLVSTAVSAVATTLGARAELIRRQRQQIMDSNRRIVAEGRDITTVVAPDAEVRILLTASEEARLRRRGAQLQGTQNAEQLRRQVTQRDRLDSAVVNFQQAADGVVTIDSSELDYEQTINAVLKTVFEVAH